MSLCWLSGQSRGRARGDVFSQTDVAYRRQRFIFSHGDTYHHTLMTEPATEWSQLELDGEAENALLYLRSRSEGRHGWIAFHRGVTTDQSHSLAA
jgi:hypothetical protein